MRSVANEVAKRLGAKIVRRRERKEGLVREVHREPGWHFIDCERCGKAISANSHRAPRREPLCKKHAPPIKVYEYPKESEARRHMIAALRTYKALAKRKRLDSDLVWERFTKELSEV